LSWEDYDDTYDGEQVGFVFAAIARLSKKRDTCVCVRGDDMWNS
jgi:hypothetical protein